MIAIQFRSADPERAAQIANAVGEAYIAEELKARKQASKRAGDWLQDRIPELRKQSSEAEPAVIDFKEKNNIVSAAGRLMDEQKVADLNNQLVTARAQTSEASARLDRIEAIIRADGPNSTRPRGHPLTPESASDSRLLFAESGLDSRTDDRW